MRRKQKGFGPIPLIIIIGIAAVLIIFFLSARKNGLFISKNIGTQQAIQSVPVIQNANDLNSVNSELDNTDLGEFDKELNQLEGDASTF
ncbi:MAG: hypothetical protein ACD_50C00233G0005 [uncultured bacterium]|nr:MAG: hypothetical protein ACD_50C00233G0005 [uncultured bacterium]